MKSLFIQAFTLLSICFASVALSQDLEVKIGVDKNPAMADESLTLTVIATGDVDREAFDPSILENNFVVGRTSVSSQTQMINFDTTHTTKWHTVLIPRKVGKFTIPSFDVAGVKTRPFEVSIIPVSGNSSGKQRDLFITTSVDMNTVYLQQQIKYSVKLHLAQDLQRGSLAAPKLKNAEIRQIGKTDKEYSEIIDGKRYRIIERTFAIIPQQSGKMTIDGPLFEGEVLDGTKQSFGFFNRTKTVNRVGPSIDIEVLPIPNGFSQNWLPSEFVQLNEEWQPKPEEYKVGEPITRTLTLTAVGLLEEQLPEISSQYPDDVKVYPDQATSATVEQDNTLIAQRVESIALIPSKEGTIVIPEVSVPWFNVVTKQTEYATLPQRTIQIGAAVADPASQLPQVSAPPLESEQTGIPPQSVVAKTNSQHGTPLWSISSWLLLILWLLTLLAWKRHSARQPQVQSDSPVIQNSEEKLWKQLNNMLKKHDPKQVYQPLTQWLGLITQQPEAALSASQLKLGNQQLDKEIKLMFDHQYGDQQQQWNSQSLSEVLSSIRQSSRSVNPKGTRLTSLYPTT